MFFLDHRVYEHEWWRRAASIHCWTVHQSVTLTIHKHLQLRLENTDTSHHHFSTALAEQPHEGISNVWNSTVV